MDEKEMYNETEKEVTNAVPPGLSQRVVVFIVAHTWLFVLAELSKGKRAAQEELRRQVRAIPGNLKNGMLDVLYGVPPEGEHKGGKKGPPKDRR